MPLQAYFYDAEGHDRKIDAGEISTADLGPEKLLWIDLSERNPADLKKIAALLGLAPDILAEDPPKRSRLDNYREFFRFSVDAAPAQPIQLDNGHLRNASGVEANGIADSVRIEFVVAESWLWDPLESTCRHASLSIL